MNLERTNQTKAAITAVGGYVPDTILSNKDLGPLNWIEFRDLKSGGDAFKQIHDGTCVAPKIILLP